MEDGTHLIGGNNKRTVIGAQTYNCMKEGKKLYQVMIKGK
jgi:hypothetical protein